VKEADPKLVQEAIEVIRKRPGPPPGLSVEFNQEQGIVSVSGSGRKDVEEAIDAIQNAVARLPADLALVGQDTDGFATLRVADLVNQPAIKRLVEQPGKYEELSPSIQTWESEFEKAVGVRPTVVERLTLMLPGAGLGGLVMGPQKSLVMLISTTQLYDRQKVLVQLAPGASEKQHAGKTYYVSAGPNAMAVHFFSDRLILVGASEAALKSFLARDPAKNRPGELRATLALVGNKYQAVLGINLQSTFIKFFISTFRKQAGVAGDTLNTLGGVQRVALLVNLRSAVFAGGDKLQLLLRLTFAKPEEGRRAAEEIRERVPTLQKGLQEFLNRFAENPKTFEEFTGGMLSTHAGAWISKFYDQLALALQGIEIAAYGNIVDVRLNDLTADVGGVGTFIGEMARTMGQVAPRFFMELGIALEDYVADHGRLPPAAILAKDGEPLLSWRVVLLPYLGHKDLYDQFKLDERWDGPHNRNLLNKIPSVYRVPGSPPSTSTSLRIITGPGTAFDDTRTISAAEIKDGSANTIAIIGGAKPVPWTKPEELRYSPDQPLPFLGLYSVFADGSVRPLSTGLDEKTRRQLISRQRGAKVDLAQAPLLPPVAVAGNLNQASWEIVRPADATPKRYRWGLRLAEKACKLKPDIGLWLNTLGVAQYRVGQFHEALATLTEADKLNAVSFKSSIVADLAFLAMSHHQLGEKDQAKIGLARLREKMKSPAEGNNLENRAFLREAETLIEGK
jgi:hypothetical protein